MTAPVKRCDACLGTGLACFEVDAWGKRVGTMSAACPACNGSGESS